MHDKNPSSKISIIELEFFRRCWWSGLGHYESSQACYLLEIMRNAKLDSLTPQSNE